MQINEFYKELHVIQKDLIKHLKVLDPNLVIKEDIWTKDDLEGGGISCSLEGQVFESGGINISHIKSQKAEELKLPGEGSSIEATGISLILHPYSPKIPTVHANFRWLKRGNESWFGGGADLTPFYPAEESFVYFHKYWEFFLKSLYPKMKKTCDEYFINSHRNNEARGIGGFFFDYEKHDPTYILHLATNFKNSYLPICKEFLKTPFDHFDKEFQLYRRGRYVEFNLLHDRGTLFGLKTKGRIESIFLSLPRNCSFFYKYEPIKEEHALMNTYYQPIDWLNFSKKNIKPSSFLSLKKDYI
jgi:coproporphyrinogen III oxidase